MHIWGNFADLKTAHLKISVVIIYKRLCLCIAEENDYCLGEFVRVSMSIAIVDI